MLTEAQIGDKDDHDDELADFRRRAEAIRQETLASPEADYVVAQTYNVDGGNWMS